MMEAEECHTEAIKINSSDMSERETNDTEMSEILAEAMPSDSGLMSENSNMPTISGKLKHVTKDCYMAELYIRGGHQQGWHSLVQLNHRL